MYYKFITKVNNTISALDCMNLLTNEIKLMLIITLDLFAIYVYLNLSKLHN